jgi:hypothetical protein
MLLFEEFEIFVKTKIFIIIGSTDSAFEITYEKTSVSVRLIL